MCFHVRVSQRVWACVNLVDLGLLIICGFQELEDSFYGLMIYHTPSSFQQWTK